MPSGAVGGVARGLARLFTSGGVAGLSEGQLLDRFVARRDEAAFEALVARHGPMVLGVCRQLLRDPNDVDDAFQATFLVLVRKAGSLRRTDLVGNWLYGVAHRVASRSRQVAARRGATETPTDGLEAFVTAPGPSPLDRVVLRELHEEVRRLPERFRTPVVLCYLEGLTHEEAAAQLRWPVGTVKGRLARARDLLRSRLTHRGRAPDAVASVPALLRSTTPPALPASLAEPTIRAAALAAVGDHGAVGLGLISSRAVALSDGVIHVMTLTHLKTSLASLALAGTVLTGTAVFAFQSAGKPKPNGHEPSNAPHRPSGTPEGLATDFEVSDRSALERLAESHRDSFASVLKGERSWDERKLERLFHLSRSMKEAEEYLTQVDPQPARNAERSSTPTQAHHDRMRRAYEAIRKVAGPRSKLAGLAESYAAGAQRSGTGGASQTPANPPPTVAVPPGQPSAPGAAIGGPAAVHQLVPPTAVQPALPLGGPGFARMGGMGGIGGGAALGGGMGGMGGSVASGGRFGGAANAVMGAGIGPGGLNGAMNPEVRENRLRMSIAGLAKDVAKIDSSPATKTVLKSLEKPIAMNFANETPLEDVLKYVKSATAVKTTGGDETPGLQIYVEPRGLYEAETTMNSPVTLDLEGVPLKTTLRLLLKQLGLAYCVKDGLIIISSLEGVHQELMEATAAEADDDAESPAEKRRSIQ